MMTHVETSYQMGFVIKLSKLLLTKYGSFHPIITIFNKGKTLPITIKSKDLGLLLDQKTYIVNDGEVVEDTDNSFSTKDPSKNIYITMLMFKLYSEDNENRIMDLYTKLTTKYDPDAISYLNCMLYNEYSDPDSVTPIEAATNPDSVRVLHCCYYTRESPKISMCFLPYINKGQIEKDESQFDISPEFSEETIEEPQYSILISDCGWFERDPKIKPVLPCPYLKQRS